MLEDFGQHVEVILGIMLKNCRYSKNLQKQTIFIDFSMVSGVLGGPSWSQVGLSWGQVGARWSQVGLKLGLSWGQDGFVGVSWCLDEL